MKEKIANKVCYGELGHPTDREETDMEKVAVCLAEPPVKGADGKLRAVFDILNTKNGQILKTLCDYGSTLGISSRGSGDLITDYDGNESVDPDTYNCEGFDVVLVPAVKEARLQYVTEALDSKRYNKTLRQSLEESLSKASDSDRKIMQESLNDLGINLNEEVDMTESSLQELQKDFEDWKAANPDVELRYLIDEYKGNLGNILYNETEYNKFVKWAKDTHSVTINPIEQDTSFDDVLNAGNEVPEEEVQEDLEATQLADMGQIKQSAIDLDSEALTEASYTKDQLMDKFGTDDLDLINAGNEEDVQLADDSFYVNETPYGFTEVIYKGRVITIDGDQITVDIDGDEAVESSLENAVKTIDELDADHNYHIEPWHDESDVKVASLGALKTMLGESMFSKKDGKFKKVAESKKEKAEPIDEAFLNDTYSMDEELSYLKDEEDDDYLTDQLEQLTNNIYELAKEARSLGAPKMSDLMQRLLDIVADEQERIDENVEDVSDKEVDNVESKDELVAGFQEALKKSKSLEKDNLSLQERLSAGNAREVQLEEELARYKKATASLSKTAKESKTLKESLDVKDKESKKLSKEYGNALQQVKEATDKVESYKNETTKLTEQVEQLKVKVSDTSKQLGESKELVNKYRKSYASLKESYVEAKASYYGISKKDALQQLGESYKVSDVDKTLKEMSAKKINMSKLPIELNESVKLSKANLSVRSSVKSVDDTSLGPLKSLLGE